MDGSLTVQTVIAYLILAAVPTTVVEMTTGKRDHIAEVELAHLALIGPVFVALRRDHLLHDLVLELFDPFFNRPVFLLFVFVLGAQLIQLLLGQLNIASLTLQLIFQFFDSLFLFDSCNF